MSVLCSPSLPPAIGAKLKLAIFTICSNLQGRGGRAQGATPAELARTCEREHDFTV
jgi:hypothetical protein